MCHLLLSPHELLQLLLSLLLLLPVVTASQACRLLYLEIGRVEEPHLTGSLIEEAAQQPMHSDCS
jgi:hypothetical protein